MSLFIGGIILQYYIIAMNGTCSPFYNGLSLIGVTVGQSGNGTWNSNSANYAYNWTCTTTNSANANTILSPTLSASVLSVVGIIAIGGILLTEFISW